MSVSGALWRNKAHTVSCKTENDDGQNTLDGAESEHQRETHFDYGGVRIVVSKRVK